MKFCFPDGIIEMFNSWSTHKYLFWHRHKYWTQVTTASDINPTNSIPQLFTATARNEKNPSDNLQAIVSVWKLNVIGNLPLI